MNQTDNNDGIKIKKMELPELLKIAIRKVINSSPIKAGTLGGAYLTKLKGRGMEFSEARPYQPGDDVRHIDWRVTARTGRTHTKLYREERERPVMLVLDQSRSMFFGSQKRLKSVQSARYAALVGWRSLLRGDRVGGAIFSEKIHHEFRPKSDRRNYLRFLSNIMSFHNSIVENMNIEEWGFKSEFLLSQALRRLRHVVQPGSLVYVFSDFSGFDAECKKHLFQLSKKSQVKACLVVDPLEKNISQFGNYAMSDGNNITWVNAGNHETMKKYTSTFVDQQDNLAAELRLCGVTLMSLSTTDSVSQIKL